MKDPTLLIPNDDRQRPLSDGQLFEDLVRLRKIDLLGPNLGAGGLLDLGVVGRGTIVDLNCSLALLASVKDVAVQVVLQAERQADALVLVTRIALGEVVHDKGEI